MKKGLNPYNLLHGSDIIVMEVESGLKQGLTDMQIFQNSTLEINRVHGVLVSTTQEHCRENWQRSFPKQIVINAELRFNSG